MTKLLDKLIELSRIENAAKVKNSSVTDIKKVITDSINQRKQIVAPKEDKLCCLHRRQCAVSREENVFFPKRTMCCFQRRQCVASKEDDVFLPR